MSGPQHADQSGTLEFEPASGDTREDVVSARGADRTVVSDVVEGDVVAGPVPSPPGSSGRAVASEVDVDAGRSRVSEAARTVAGRGVVVRVDFLGSALRRGSTYFLRGGGSEERADSLMIAPMTAPAANAPIARPPRPPASALATPNVPIAREARAKPTDSLLNRNVFMIDLVNRAQDGSEHLMEH
jgi:hypothetical protein